jgi:hypothetical protein
MGIAMNVEAVNQFGFYAKFEELPIGTVFLQNGMLFRKKTKQTAIAMTYDRSLRFRQAELCQVGEYSRLSADYFKGQ